MEEFVTIIMPSVVPLGQIVATPGVLALVDSENDLLPLLARYTRGDWGDVDAEDKQTNDEAVRDGTRILAAYTLKGEKVWIITEWDRSVTTFLLPEEY
jgi:hypothetical protein